MRQFRKTSLLFFLLHSLVLIFEKDLIGKLFGAQITILFWFFFDKVLLVEQSLNKSQLPDLAASLTSLHRSFFLSFFLSFSFLNLVPIRCGLYPFVIHAGSWKGDHHQMHLPFSRSKACSFFSSFFFSQTFLLNMLYSSSSSYQDLLKESSQLVECIENYGARAKPIPNQLFYIGKQFD